MANTADGKKRFLSILKILMRDSDRETHLTSEDIRKTLLEEYDIDADRRSIRNDIKVMIDGGIVKDSGKAGTPRDGRGAYYDSWRFEDWELKMLIDSISEVKCIRSKEIQSIIARLESFGGPGTRELLKKNEPALEPYDYWMEEEFRNTLIELLQAIKLRKKITFNYGKLNAEKKFELRRPERYKVSPYSIQNNEGSYYLICNTDEKPDISTYRVDRMRNLEIDDESSISPSRLPAGDLTEAVAKFHLNNTDSFSGPSQVVEVRWLEDIKEISILYDVFGVDSVSKKSHDGDQVFVIRAQENKRLYNNLLRLGNTIEIIAPSSVRERYVSIIREISEIY